MRLLDQIAETCEFLRDGISDYIKYKKTEALVRRYFDRLRKLNSFETPLTPVKILDAMVTISKYKRNREAYKNSKKTA